MQSELIVLSHLRWEWVWQRPQHLISRVGRGRKTWFVEEPWPAEVSAPRLATKRADGLTRVWLDIPEAHGHVGFEPDYVRHYMQGLPELVGRPRRDRIVWLYTPMALEVAEALEPDVLVYDVMDDLASFKDAPPSLIDAQNATLAAADVVFAGGRSLHRGVVERGRTDALLFPSGVEPEHYEQAREHHSFHIRNERPVAGYVGVIDERLDLDLVERLAHALPDWEIRMVGPVTKIEPEQLPQAPNLVYTGPRQYADLPEVMAGFDVALMPFALNEATRSISPTKTLEYLAAGLPVVSTAVPDVVADFFDVVDIQEGTEGFASACRHVIEHDLGDRDEKLRPLLYRHHWDTIASEMMQAIDDVRVSALAEEMPA